HVAKRFALSKGFASFLPRSQTDATLLCSPQKLLRLWRINKSRRLTMDKGYTLPDLPYDYAALEPHYSARLLELHHDKHHAAYVTGANTTLEKLAEARDKGDFAGINQLQKNLAFHLSGHVLHSLFCRNISEPA